MMNNDPEGILVANRPTKLKVHWRGVGMTNHWMSHGDFTCAHCRQYISANPFLSGVNNRNHCPYCLWSRHMDLYEAGDRLAACKAPMRPVGMTLKKTHKKYGSSAQGELMLIHLCAECGKVSINRMAADDDAERALAVFENSLDLSPQMITLLEQNEIRALEASQVVLVRERLFGRVCHRPHRYPLGRDG